MSHLYKWDITRFAPKFRATPSRHGVASRGRLAHAVRLLRARRREETREQRHHGPGRARRDSAREGRRVWEQAKKSDAARFCRQLLPSAQRTSDFPRRLVTFRRDVFESITSGRARTAARVRAPGGRPSTLARRGGVARRDGVARAGQGAGGGHARRTGRESARGDPFSAVGVGSKGRLPLEPRCCWAFRSRLRA